MSIGEIIELIVIIGLTIGLIVILIKDIASKNIKTFVEEKMIEAEKSGKSGTEKLQFVVDAVKEKYKLLTIFLNIKNVVERIIELSKQINSK